MAMVFAGTIRYRVPWDFLLASRRRGAGASCGAADRDADERTA